MRKTVSHLLIATVILISSGCRQESIRTYKVAKEPAADALPAASAAVAGPAPGISWKAPDGWEPRAANSVRIGSYSVPSPAGSDPADFSITSFPGDVGGDLANINRWRQQIGLTPVAEDGLPPLLSELAASAGNFITVNLANPEKGVRVLAAIFKQPEKTWFFKLAGPDALVASQEAAFTALLQSVEFQDGLTPPAGGAAPAMPAGSGMMSGNTNDLPAGHPPIPGLAIPSDMPATTPAVAASATSGPPALRWAAPDHWTAKDLGPMRKASYTVHGMNGLVADFSIISLAGDGGGFHDNVNRWRGQIGLPPAEGTAIDKDVRHMDSAGMHFDVVEFASEGADAQRVIGAFLSISGETWFFKLIGPDAVVAADRDSFIQFIRTVRLR